MRVREAVQGAVGGTPPRLGQVVQQVVRGEGEAAAIAEHRGRRHTMSADRPIAERKPLSEWAAVPRWVLDKIAGDVAAQLNLKLWQVEGPRLCWPEDLAELERLRAKSAVTQPAHMQGECPFTYAPGTEPPLPVHKVIGTCACGEPAHVRGRNGQPLCFPCAYSEANW